MKEGFRGGIYSKANDLINIWGDNQKVHEKISIEMAEEELAAGHVKAKTC